MNIAPDSYHILMECSYNDSAVIEELLDGNIDERDFNRGNILNKEISEKLTLSFSENYPENIKLYDFVENTMSFLIVSDKVKSVFETEKVNHIEYIPISLKDHRGNIAGDNYYIANFLSPQPIIDMDKSEYHLSNLDQMILHIQKLHLDISKIEEDAKLFRATTEESTNFIREDLLQALKSAGVTGIKTVPAEGWDGNTFSF